MLLEHFYLFIFLYFSYFQILRISERKSFHFFSHTFFVTQFDFNCDCPKAFTQFDFDWFVDWHFDILFEIAPKWLKIVELFQSSNWKKELKQKSTGNSKSELISENYLIPADEMDTADDELRETIRMIWPLHADKMTDLLVPRREKSDKRILSTGKIYAGLLILDSWRTSRFGQMRSHLGVRSLYIDFFLKFIEWIDKQYTIFKLNLNWWS